MARMIRHLTLALAMPLITAVTLSADEPEPPSDDVLDVRTPLTITVEPLAMYITPGGRFILPGRVRGGRDIDVEHVNIDSPRLSPGLRLDLTYGDWIASASGFSYTTDRDTLSPVDRSIGDLDLTTGQPINTKFTFSTAEAWIGYTVLDGSAARREGEEDVLHAGVSLFAGARAYWMDIELTNPQGTASADPVFVEPIAGIVLSASALDRYDARVRASVGYMSTGSDTSASFQIESDLAARIAEGVSLVAGYRMLIVDLEQGDVIDKFEYRGSMAGLHIGLRFRF